MRAVMASAEVGDDVFRDDPTIHELGLTNTEYDEHSDLDLSPERRMAELTGKEAALFVPSGTMGNLICVMSHCWGRGQEMLLGEESLTYSVRSSRSHNVHLSINVKMFLSSSGPGPSR